jgi:hypothetical protein
MTWEEIAGLHKLGFPEVNLPKTNLESVDKVLWPAGFDLATVAG